MIPYLPKRKFIICDIVSENIRFSHIHIFLSMLFIWRSYQDYIATMIQMMDCEMTGETEELGRKPASVALCPPQIPHDITGVQPRPPR
jgi:hypothetical protein